MTEVEKKLKAITKRELTFISKGYTNWKDACEAFQKHFNSVCHKEAVESIELPLKTGDVGEMLCTEHKKEKEANRAMLRKIIESIATLLAAPGTGTSVRMKLTAASTFARN